MSVFRATVLADECLELVHEFGAVCAEVPRSSPRKTHS